MKLRLCLVLLALLVVAPAARADQPPYPVCAPVYAFDWHLGTTVYGTSPYVVALNAPDASEVWTKTTSDGRPDGTWVRRPLSKRERLGGYLTITPVLGPQTISVGFRVPGTTPVSDCLATESRHVDGRFRLHLDRVRASVKAGTLRVWGYRAGRDCHSLGGGAYVWKIPVNGKTRRVSSVNACGPLDGAGTPTARTMVRSRFYTVRIGTASSRGSAPASYLELTAAHPRKSGRVLVRLWAERIEHPTPGATHAQLVPLKVTVTVRYTPGAHPTWTTSVKLGWPKVKNSGAPAGSGDNFGSGGDGGGLAGDDGTCVGC
jgi:hypothetical protein